MSRGPFAPDKGVEASVYVSGPAERRLGDVGTMPPRLRRRRAFTLILLTLVLPGSAQLAAGNRRLGRMGIRVWLALWAVGLVTGLVLLVSRSAVLSLFARSWALEVVQWVLFGLAALWAVLFLDAWRLAQPGRLHLPVRRWLTGLTAALLVVTSGGLVYAATNVGAGQDALNALFQGKRAVEPTNGRYNVLLLGADTGRNRVGTRPDSIQLVSVDAETGRAVTFGFSRDTENINFRAGSLMQRVMPEGWNCGDECLLNGLYTWADDHRDQFPAGVANPGVVATREAVEALSGLDVHYYVLVDLSGFQKMIDALGGLQLTVKRRTPIGGGTSPISGWIEPGTQRLDGRHALWYARSRHGSTNYERMARQRCVITAMVGQLDPQTVLLRFPKIASASSSLVQTDLPQSELGYFADLALKTRSQKIRGVNFVPPLIKPWDYDAAMVHRTVRQTIEASEKSKEKPVVQAAKPAAAATKPGASASTPAAKTAAKPAPKPGTPAAVQDPSAAGNAAEADLTSVCSAAS